ncbi:MAG: hypothetical protein HY700_03665 [Gemmatimonadetes bacterium]|nr:hypothetical protein [Gemmatimonadota bacterium]
MILPTQATVSPGRRRRLARLAEQTRANPPADLAAAIRNDLGVNLSARYGGLSLPHPFGKASGQLSTTILQVEADAAAGIAFVVLKTVIAEDESGHRAMEAWTVRETRMKVEKRRSAGGREGWTVTWKGRGWHGSLAEYREFFERSLAVARGRDVPVIPSVKYHLPQGGEPFREEEYRHTTQTLLDVWNRAGCGGPMLLEKDFSPTLAGDDRAKQRDSILRWLFEVPHLIQAAAPGRTRVGMKLMNALFDDRFQVEMVRAALPAHPAFLVVFNRLFDPEWKVAFGGYDLSDRNLRVLDALLALPDASLPPLCATGNICSGRMMVEYALRGAESGQVHTFFQVPLSEYTATGGSRTARALHTLMLHPDEGLVMWLWHLNEHNLLPERSGEIRFLDLVTEE